MREATGDFIVKLIDGELDIPLFADVSKFVLFMRNKNS